MFRISIKKTHQQKTTTTLQVFFFGKWAPLGIAGKSNITKTLWSFQNQRFWSCFFRGNLQLRDVGSEKRQGEDDFWFNPTAGVRDPQGWYLSEELDGAISERQCFRQDATLMICDRFFVFEMIILHGFWLQSWMSETRMVEIYVCTSLHEQSCNCEINASEIGLFIKQSLSGVMLGKVELHPTLGGCMNRWPSLPWVCSNPHVHVHRERETYIQTQTHIAYTSLWYICPKICWCWCGLSRFFQTHPKPQLCEARMYREDSQLSRLDALDGIYATVMVKLWAMTRGMILVDFVSTNLMQFSFDEVCWFCIVFGM